MADRVPEKRAVKILGMLASVRVNDAVVRTWRRFVENPKSFGCVEEKPADPGAWNAVGLAVIHRIKRGSAAVCCLLDLFHLREVFRFVWRCVCEIRLPRHVELGLIGSRVIEKDGAVF